MAWNAAQARAMRRKYKLGEFAPKRKKAKRRRKQPPRRRRAPSRAPRKRARHATREAASFYNPFRV